MLEPFDLHGYQEPRLPRWLARDLGIDPTTRLRPVSRSWMRTQVDEMLHAVSRPRPDAVLGSIPLFDGLSKRDRRLASRLATTVGVAAGTMLTEEGAVGAEFFVVLEGEVEVSRAGQVIATQGPGSPLGEMALLEGSPRTATLLAKTSVSTLVYGRQEFDDLVGAVPEVSERLRALIEERRAA